MDIGFGDIYSQNSATWIAEYDKACAGLVFFAEDLFGDRYAFNFRSTSDKEPSFVKFLCEGGEVETMPYFHLSDFVNEILSHKDIRGFNGKLAQAALQVGLCPTLDQHLAFKLPLIAGGEYSLNNLGVEPAQMHLHVLAQFTEQMQSAKANTGISKFLVYEVEVSPVKGASEN